MAEGFCRRRLLRGAFAVAVGGGAALLRWRAGRAGEEEWLAADAWPIRPDAGTPTPPNAADARELDPQLAARLERTHTDCYRLCMEARTAAEIQAWDALEDAVARSPELATVHAAAFRAQLNAIYATFQQCKARCP